MATFARNPGGGNAQTGGGFASVLPEDFDAYFQAVGEANGGKKTNFMGATDASSDVDPNADAGSLFAGHSNQMQGTPYMPSLEALKRMGRGRG